MSNSTRDFIEGFFSIFVIVIVSVCIGFSAQRGFVKVCVQNNLSSYCEDLCKSKKERFVIFKAGLYINEGICRCFNNERGKEMVYDISNSKEYVYNKLKCSEENE